MQPKWALRKGWYAVLKNILRHLQNIFGIHVCHLKNKVRGRAMILIRPGITSDTEV